MNPGRWVALGYGRWAPPHRGRWSIIAAMIRRFGLRRPEEVVAERRGVRFRLRLDRFLDVHLYYTGVHDAAETAFLEANLAPGDVVLDLGANFGWYSLVAGRRIAPDGRVHAFEISADELDRLHANLALNPDLAGLVQVNRVAVMDRPGEIGITPTYGAGTTHVEPGAGAIRVPATSLDDYVAAEGLARVDFVKCDIEGAELHMIRGAGDLLERLRPVILLEINPAALEALGSTAPGVVAALRSHRYTLYRLVPRGFGWRAAPLCDADLPAGDGFLNVVAAPEERTIRYAARAPVVARTRASAGS